MAGGSLFGRLGDRSSSICGDPGESRLMVRVRQTARVAQVCCAIQFTKVFAGGYRHWSTDD
jgi:hypothetical protein